MERWGRFPKLLNKQLYFFSINKLVLNNTRGYCNQNKSEVRNENNKKEELETIGDNDPVKTILSKIKSGQKLQFRGNYHNLLTLYRALKTRTDLSKNPPSNRTKKELLTEVIDRKKNQKKILNSLFVEVERKNIFSLGKLKNIKGSEAALEVRHLPADYQIALPASLDQTGSGFYPFHFIQSLRSCSQRKVPCKQLGVDLEIGYGVFPPTRKDYIKLFDSCVQQWCWDNLKKIHLYAQNYLIADVGCGSGVLGFLLLKHLSPNLLPNQKAYLLGVDRFHEAIRCSFNNAIALNMNEQSYFIQSADNLFPILSEKDTVHSLFKKPSNKLLKLAKDGKYDFIVSNPPWLPFTDSNGNEIPTAEDITDTPFFPTDSPSTSFLYDDSNLFIETLISSAKERLQERGYLFLVHSTLASELDVQPKDYIQSVCEKNGMQVLNIYQTEYRVKLSQDDWFVKEKTAAKVLLYVITHKSFAVTEATKR